MINALLVVLFPIIVFSQTYIDPNKTLFGVEYSFQDLEMVNEPGRSTLTTPHKQTKVAEMAQYFASEMGLPQESIQPKSSWKPGLFILVPGAGKYVINSEPVTVEFNTTPKHRNEIAAAATPIYSAAKNAGLVPYVNPAAERSGMGHIHIGGNSLEESPFYIHENLLRNVYAFFHKHPALLYGFSEAYDMGVGSNIETLHESDKQQALSKIFADFDQLIQNTPQESRSNGLIELIRLFKTQRGNISWTRGGGFDGWFAHYRFINIEHLENLSPESDPTQNGKQTVEFRPFRPPPTPEHAEAMVELLISVLDYLAKPNYLEKFEIISKEHVALFKTGSVVQADWEKLKKLLNLKNKYLDSMVQDYVSNIHNKKLPSISEGVEIFESYSEKELKGTQFEIRLEKRLFPEVPAVKIGGNPIYFEMMILGRKKYWVGHLDSRSNEISAEEFRSDPRKFVTFPSIQKKSCQSLL